MGRLQILTAVGVRGVSMCVAPSLMFSTENYCPLKTDYEVLADCTVELTGYGCGQSKVPNLSFTKEGRPVKKPKNLSNQDDEPLNCASDDWSECEQLSLDEKISPTTDTPSTPSLISVSSLASMVWDYEYDLKDNKSLISSNSGSSELENHLSRSGLENGGSSPDYTTELLRSSSQSSSSSSKGRNLKATVDIQHGPIEEYGAASQTLTAPRISAELEYGAASRASTAPEHEEDKLDLLHNKSSPGSISGSSELTNGLFKATVENSSFRVKSSREKTSREQNLSGSSSSSSNPSSDIDIQHGPIEDLCTGINSIKVERKSSKGNKPFGSNLKRSPTSIHKSSCQEPSVGMPESRKPGSLCLPKHSVVRMPLGGSTTTPNVVRKKNNRSLKQTTSVTRSESCYRGHYPILGEAATRLKTPPRLSIQKTGNNPEQEDQKFHCSECDMKCSTPDILKHHMRVSHGVRH